MLTNSKWDVLCVGSSPLMLLEALHQDQLGKRVLLTESAGRLGGAWGEIEVFGLHRAENAPHVIMFNRVTYDFLARDLGVKMAPMLPPPRYVVSTSLGRLWLSYLLSPFLAYVTVPVHYLTNPQYRANFRYIREEYFGRLTDAPQQLWMWLKGLIFAGQKPAIEYPVGGTLELLDRLKELLAGSRVTVHLNTRIESLERLAEGGFHATAANGDAIIARHVFMTCHQRLGALRLPDGSTLNGGFEVRPTVSLHLLVGTALPARASFVLPKREPMINLVSDLTSFTQGVPEGKRVIVVRMHRHIHERDLAAAERIYRQLVEWCYFPAPAKLEGFHFSEYPHGLIPHDHLQKLEAAAGKDLTVFRSSNFSNSIGAEVQRWRATVRGQSQRTHSRAPARIEAEDLVK